MKKQVRNLLALGCAALLLAGCGQIPKEDIGAVVGAGLGGLAGSVIGDGGGQLVAIGVGTLLGAMMGAEVGKSLDRADKLALAQAQQNALESGVSGSKTTWKNPDSGNSGEEKVLYDCVFNHILKLSIQENFTSVAIPAINAEVSGFPTSVSTSVIVEAVKDFLDKSPSPSSLQEVHLVDNRQESGEAFVSAIEKQFKTSQPPTTHGQNADLSAIKG